MCVLLIYESQTMVLKSVRVYTNHGKVFFSKFCKYIVIEPIPLNNIVLKPCQHPVNLSIGLYHIVADTDGCLRLSFIGYISLEQIYSVSFHA